MHCINDLKDESYSGYKRDKTLDLCTKAQSVEKIEKRLPKIGKVSKHEEENWAIKALPSDWKPVSLPSIAVRNVTKKRKIEHNKRLAQMENEMADINVKIEKKIRLKSEWIKEIYDRVQTQSETEMTRKLKRKALAKFLPHEFEDISKEIQILHAIYLGQIKQFYDYLLQLEKTRCYHFKNFLKNAFDDLHRVSFKLPRELQEMFEHKILHINQITLSNLRCYHDICSTLQLQGENSIRRWLQATASLKGKWKAAQKEQLTQKLIDIRISSNPELIQKEVARNVNIQFDLKHKEPTYSSSLSQVMLLPLQAGDVNEWCGAVEGEIRNLGHTTKTLVNLYRGAIIQVFNGYMEEFQNISEKMIDSGVVDDSELEQFNKEVAVPIIDEISTQLSSKISGIKLLWEEVSLKLDAQTKTTVSFLRGAALIWATHFERIDTLKNIILKELDQAIETNSKLSEKKESSICVAIDKLRQESTKTALDKGLTRLNKLLDDLQDVYVDDCQKELKIINKYPDLAHEETELLMKELRQFLNAYPKKVGVIRRASRCTIPEEPELILPAQMKMCEYEVQALDNWMLGLWEAIDKYLLTCEDELAEKAEQWKDTHVKRILKRLEVKVAFHKARYDRSRINIYNSRFAELEAHVERFDRHKTEIGIQMEEMSVATTTIANKIQTLLDKEYESLEFRIQRKVETAKNSQLVSAISYEVEIASKKLETLATDMMKEYNETMETKQNRIFESNHEFRKSMQFFSDDGNFSQDEAKRYFNELKKLEAALVKKVQVLQKEADTKFQKIESTSQQKCANLLNMLKIFKEELQFREEVINEIRKLQTDLKLGIYDKKYTLKRFSAEIRRLSHPIFCDVENFGRFKTNFKDLIERMQGFQMYLLKKEIQPDSISVSSGRNPSKVTSVVSKLSRTSGITSKSSTPKSKPSSGATTSSGTDYTGFLFSVRPPDTCTFMTEFNTALYESMNNIQRLAKQFYRKDRIIRNTELLQPNLHLFMEEVLQKYRSYSRQVEMAWMDVTNETLKLLKQLLHFIWKQYEIILQNFCDTTVNDANKEQNEKIQLLDEIRENYETANKELHERVKVHYGYYNNKSLLDIVLKGADKHKQKLISQNAYEWLDSYETMQMTDRDAFLTELDSLENELKSLKDLAFNLINPKLIQQFEDNLHFKTKSMPSVQKDNILTNWSTISEMSLHYETLKSQSKVSSECKAGLTPKNTLVSLCSVFTQEVSKNSLMDIDGEISYEETLSKDDVIKVFDQKLYERVNQINQIQRKFDDVIEKWTKIWATSKEKICDLYIIKYDNA